MKSKHMVHATLGGSVPKVLLFSSLTHKC